MHIEIYTEIIIKISEWKKNYKIYQENLKLYKKTCEFLRKKKLTRKIEKTDFCEKKKEIIVKISENKNFAHNKQENLLKTKSSYLNQEKYYKKRCVKCI